MSTMDGIIYSDTYTMWIPLSPFKFTNMDLSTTEYTIIQKMSNLNHILNLVFLRPFSQPFSYHSIQQGNIKGIANLKYTDVPERCNKWSARG